MRIVFRLLLLLYSTIAFSIIRLAFHYSEIKCKINFVLSLSF